MKTTKENKEDIAMKLACMIGAYEASDYADSVYRSAEMYKELTGKDLGIKRPEVKKIKWYQKLFNNL